MTARDDDNREFAEELAETLAEMIQDRPALLVVIRLEETTQLVVVGDGQEQRLREYILGAEQDILDALEDFCEGRWP